MLVSLGVLIVMLRLKEDIIDIVQRVQGGQFEHVGKHHNHRIRNLQ